MIPEKTALVLGGGGSRGAYEIGVWRALKELGIGFSIVTGTSVGALNGAIIAQGDYDTAVRIWNSITTEMVLSLDLPEDKSSDTDTFPEQLQRIGAFVREIAVQGGADSTPLKNLLESVLDENAVRKSDIRFGMVTVRLPDMRPKAAFIGELPEGSLVDYVLASASCFPAMQSHMIDGKAYIDGGYYDNIPIDLAVQGGAEDVIAVDIKGIGRHRQISPLSPEHLHVITTAWDLGSILDFNAENARHNMELGYLDTLKSWGKLSGLLYAFPSDIVDAFERLFDCGLQIFADFYPASGATAPLYRLTKMRLLRHLYGLYRSLPNAPKPTQLREGDDSNILPLAFAENAGKVFGLDPAVLYTANDYLDSLRAAYSSAEPLDIARVEILFSDRKPLSEFAAEFESIGPARIAKSIGEFLKNHGNIPVHWTTTLPAEFLAALAAIAIEA